MKAINEEFTLKWHIKHRYLIYFLRLSTVWEHASFCNTSFYYCNLIKSNLLYSRLIEKQFNSLPTCFPSNSKQKKPANTTFSQICSINLLITYWTFHLGFYFSDNHKYWYINIYISVFVNNVAYIKLYFYRYIA